MAEANLSNLPVVVLHLIFHYCDARTILRTIRFVCKKLRDAVDRYNQIELELDWKDLMYSVRFPYSAPVHAVSSLIISFKDEFHEEDEMRWFISRIHRFTQVRYLSLRDMNNQLLQLFFKYLNYTHLLSCTIDSRYEPDIGTCSAFVSMIERSNLQKLCWKELYYDMNNISWPRQCKLTHLTINRCLYSQCHVILQQLPYLNTLQLTQYTMDTENMPDVSFTSQLKCLIIKYFTLSIQQLRLIVSKTPALRYLRLGPASFDRELLSIAETNDWENFFRSELNFLDRLEFFFIYKISSDNVIGFDSIVAPFQKPFWLIEKRWRVVCECILNWEDIILLYTIPVNLGKFVGLGYSTHGIVFMDNNYYINRYKNYPKSITTACDVSHG